MLLLLTVFNDGLAIPQINTIYSGRQRFALAVLPRSKRKEKFAVALAEQNEVRKVDADRRGVGSTAGKLRRMGVENIEKITRVLA